MSSNKKARITEPADDFDEFEVCTDTDLATCSNYSDRAEFTANSEDSEDSSIPLKRSLAARKHTPVVKAKGKETSEDTPVGFIFNLKSDIRIEQCNKTILHKS